MARFVSTPALCAALATLSLPSLADAAADERGTLTTTVENDVVSGQDRHYTNGLRLAYVTAPVKPNALERWLGGLRAEEGTVRRSFAAGQSIYTPENIFTAKPLPGDHPYAGHLFAEAALLTEKNGRWDLYTLEVGIVGSAALAEETQNWFHRSFDFIEAQGWDSQLENEAAINFSYDWKGAPVAKGEVGTLDWEVTPAAGLSLGNVAVNARAGGMLRIGDSLDPNFGPARIRPSLTGSGHYAENPGFGWYAFAGVQGRVVGHDIFLDGSLFRDDETGVEKNSFVADAQAGLALTYGRAQLSWTYVHRTERYEAQNGADAFGALSLSIKL
jgi:hypothetical protein